MKDKNANEAIKPQKDEEKLEFGLGQALEEKIEPVKKPEVVVNVNLQVTAEELRGSPLVQELLGLKEERKFTLGKLFRR